MDKVIITCALTGVAATRKQCAAIPYTPAEIAEDAYRAYNAGASVVHIHAREDDGRPSQRVEVYAEIRDRIRAKCPLIINFSTGAIDVPAAERVAHITELQPEIGALNMGSMNYAKYSSEKKQFYFDHVFANPFGEIVMFLQAMNQAGVKPELECFDMGHIHNAAPLYDMGILSHPTQYSLILGVTGGIAPTVENLVHMAKALPPQATLEVIGISHHQWRLVAAAIAMGGNIRVGLEDNFYLRAGEMAKHNGELVDKAANLVRELGQQVATVEEARQLLSLPQAALV
jgi:uncharacterized protein (DUF849 family)